MENNGVHDPWEEYNENVKRCRTVLLCGNKIRGEWLDISKIIARKMYRPLEREKCMEYLDGKACHVYEITEFDYGIDKMLTCCNELICVYHYVCKMCYRPGGHFNPNDSDFNSDYLCEKCKIK